MNKLNLIFPYIFVSIIATFIISCNNNEKIYLNYEEVALKSYPKLNLTENTKVFLVFNEGDSIYLKRNKKMPKTLSNYKFNNINLTSVDSAITRLSEITFDNLDEEKLKGLPEIYIIKKDSFNEKWQVFQFEQAYILSETRWE